MFCLRVGISVRCKQSCSTLYECVKDEFAFTHGWLYSLQMEICTIVDNDVLLTDTR